MVRDEVVAFREDLAAVDGSDLSDRQRVDIVAELERVKGAVAAAQARVTHALRRSREVHDPRDVARSVGSEVALARRCSPTLGDRFVGLARALVDEMPATMSALSSGVCSERHAVVVARATAVLSLEDRAEVDRRVGPLLGRLGVTAAERAARRVAAELDAAAVVRRMERAVRSRRVTVRPAPDGMAYLSVLGPMVEVVGAHAALLARARSVVGGQCAAETPDGRGVGAVAADTALRALSGRLGSGALQPVEVHLVMTDRALLGTGDGRRSVTEPARVPGHGSLPAPVARSWLSGRGAESAETAETAETAERRRPQSRSGYGASTRDPTVGTSSRWTPAVAPSQGSCDGCSSCATTSAPPRGATPSSPTPTTPVPLARVARRATSTVGAPARAATSPRRRRAGRRPCATHSAAVATCRLGARSSSRRPPVAGTGPRHRPSSGGGATSAPGPEHCPVVGTRTGGPRSARS